MLWVDHIANHHFLTLGGSYSSYLDSGKSPVTAKWQNIAATYDGTTARYFVDGVEVASRAAPTVGSSDTWRIGAYGASPGGFFDGVIDDVRIYNRALAPGEIQTNMNQPVPGTRHDCAECAGDAGGIERHRAASSSRWGAATDNVAVTRYNVHRSTSSGFTPSTGEPIGQPTGTATPKRASRPARTTTRSRPRTRPATSAPLRPRRARRSWPTRHRRPSRSRRPQRGATLNGSRRRQRERETTTSRWPASSSSSTASTSVPRTLTAPYTLSWDTRAS